uniref:uncharacterized protein LOC106993865 isoform X2 n=1 Tax=Macaca mulatta TaxID=9544 RepID=UPI0010A29601|nr:uncharacterized protein LOC106993865 isoform X2 [Macaca mulatta]
MKLSATVVAVHILAVWGPCRRKDAQPAQRMQKPGRCFDINQTTSVLLSWKPDGSSHLTPSESHSLYKDPLLWPCIPHPYHCPSCSCRSRTGLLADPQTHEVHKFPWQGLCTGCPHCQERLPPRSLDGSLPRFLQIFALMSPAQWGSL